MNSPKPFADQAAELLNVAGILETAALHLRTLVLTATRPLKRICSWCNTTVADGTLPATHTICDACIIKMQSGYQP